MRAPHSLTLLSAFSTLIAAAPTPRPPAIAQEVPTPLPAQLSAPPDDAASIAARLQGDDALRSAVLAALGEDAAASRRLAGSDDGCDGSSSGSASASDGSASASTGSTAASSAADDSGISIFELTCLIRDLRASGGDPGGGTLGDAT